MNFLIVLGTLLGIFCVCAGIAAPSLALRFFGIAIIVTIAIALVNTPKKVPLQADDDTSAYEDPSAYEEHQAKLPESCSDAQEYTSDNLYCDPGE